jgi:hypothetical protein
MYGSITLQMRASAAYFAIWPAKRTGGYWKFGSQSFGPIAIHTFADI